MPSRGRRYPRGGNTPIVKVPKAKTTLAKILPCSAKPVNGCGGKVPKNFKGYELYAGPDKLGVFCSVECLYNYAENLCDNEDY